MGTITDDQGDILATVEVEEIDPARFEGTILTSHFPTDLVSLLREFEGLSNDQLFPLLDNIEEEISKHALFYVNRHARISRFQLWGENGIHFQIEMQLPQRQR